MPNTKITRQRWKDHLYYGKWIYIVLAIAAVFITDLLYSTTEYRSPDEKKVTIQFVSGSASISDDIDDTTSQIFAAIQPMDETLELVEFFSINFSGDESDYYGAQKFFVELAAGENDIYVSSKLIVNSIISQGAALPLDEYIESGLLSVPEGAELLTAREPVYDENGNDLGTGEMRIYGFSTDPMVQMPYKTYMNNEGNYFVVTAMSMNPETSLLAMQELYALWSQPLPEMTEAEGEAAGEDSDASASTAEPSESPDMPADASDSAGEEAE